MENGNLNTQFAPSERKDIKYVLKQSESVSQGLSHFEILDNLPLHILIINQFRQIVFANKEFQNMLSKESITELLGKRPGEVLQCLNSDKNSGCGTSLACSVCGLVNTILECQKNGKGEGECSILQINNHSINLFVRASQSLISGQEYTLIILTDISNEKRRQAIERIFFHDVLNTAGNLKNIIEILLDDRQEDNKEFLNIIASLSNVLIDEINSFRTLYAAERGDLEVIPAHLNTKKILEEITTFYRYQEISFSKKVSIEPDCYEGEITTDKILLSRVISNLIKNALEASKANEVINVNCKFYHTHYEFTVQNPAVMPDKIQLQLFHKSFSTKGIGRGIGTYSIKLITESYLHGEVSFLSNPNSGTIFNIKLPLSILS